MSTSIRRSCVLLLATLGMVGGSSLQFVKAETVTVSGISSTRYAYPEEVVSGFVSTCSSEPSQLPPEIKRQLCTCLVAEFQNQYSYSEFEAIGKRVQAGETPPKALSETVDRCVDKVLKVQK